MASFRQSHFTLHEQGDALAGFRNELAQLLARFDRRVVDGQDHVAALNARPCRGTARVLDDDAAVHADLLAFFGR